LNVVAKILEILSSNPDGVLQSYLVKALSVSKAYVSLVLRDLERRGVVYRVRIGNAYVVKLASARREAPAFSGVLRLGVVWSSEYLFLGHFAKLLRDREGLGLEVRIYPSALQATLALIRGEVEAALSPVVTQVYGYIISKGLAIVGGGAAGGGYVYEIPSSRASTIISSEVSSMDLCRTLAIKKRLVDVSEEDTTYFSSTQEAIGMARRGLARYAVIWHPINIDLEKIGGKRILRCSEFEELSACCTLAIVRSLDMEAIEKISRVYREAIEHFNRNKTRYLEWYSSITGIDTATLRKALDEYTYSPELSPKLFNKIIDALGLEAPNKNSLRQAIQF